MATITDETNAPSGLDPVVYEAQKRWRRCEKWESTARQHFLDDYKFANADVYNGYQWPNNIKRNRDIDERPCLTINKTQQHNNQIKNASKQNRPGIKYRATGGGASYKSAQMFDAVAKHIEYKSSADNHYDTAMDFCVDAGIGWLRLGTVHLPWDKQNPAQAFSQDIRILGVSDALTVFIDPDAREKDKSDAKFAFLFEDKNAEEFKKEHPKWAEEAGQNALGDADGWMTMDTVRIAEYYRLKEIKDKLVAVEGQDGKLKVFRRSELKEAAALDAFKALEADESSRTLDITECKLEYYYIVGTEVKEERSVAKGNPLPGDAIPVVPVVASEIIIEGTMDRKSHTRALIDPQRMYNYWSSTAVEYGALQTKTPWVAPAEAIEDFESYWNTANTANYSVLPYNAMSDDGNVIPPPKRVEPPVAAPVCITGMQVAQTEMMLVSGQYQATMGEQGNERSGKAINERQQQGETATFHFNNALSVAIKRLGQIMYKWIVELYDTERMILCMAQDGSEMRIKIDPKAAQAYQLEQMENAETSLHIFNPKVGEYEVEADVGPSFGTRRQEAWNALTLILTQAPQLTSIIGDLLLRSGDFPLAEEAAARLRRMVPAQALGEGPSQNEAQLMQQNSQLTVLLKKAMEEMSELNLKVRGKDQLRDVDVFKAFTERLKVVTDAAIKSEKPIDPKELNLMMDQAVEEILSTSLQPIIQANAPGLESSKVLGEAMTAQNAPPMPGAKMGADGHWYMRQLANNPNMMPVS